ncbi:hypothetical protein BBP40_012030 [Aspergillus hancockii]|nr:hypothetical protein BBP40_012030 [Aspergillus hancockii]
MQFLSSLLGFVTLATAQNTFTNPVLWEDLADIDVIRVDDAFYYSASTMHHSPGAPILRSYDLVNWEYVGHSVPSMDFGEAYSLEEGKRAYVQGIWASTIGYRRSSEKFYWLGCIRSDLKTYIYTASAAEGPWEQSGSIDNCYYDAGLLIDEDDTMYVAYGSTNIQVAQLSDDGLSEVSTQLVYAAPSNIGYIEGARMYKINGNYYIWLTRPASDQFVLKSTSGPFGPYELREVVIGVQAPVSGAGSPHQGGLVDTPEGDWYYMAFIDAYPGGRLPVLAPVSWDAEGWPTVELDNGAWGKSYPYPTGNHAANVSIPTSYTFTETALGAEWEWNHNPDASKWSLANGLILQTVSVTEDLYQAKNTLTRRIPGPQATATLRLDISAMVDGDRAGLALFRDSSAWIGIRRDSGRSVVSMTSGLAMNADWTTASTGTEEARTEVSTDEIFLRVNVDISVGSGRVGSFSFSQDGTNYTVLGGDFALKTAWQFFLGYRFGIFNYATAELGGKVTVKEFAIDPN